MLNPTATQEDPPLAPDTPAACEIGILLEQLVEQIATNFGRLTYFATLHGPELGAYRHPSLGLLAPPHELNRIFLIAHQEVFGRWLELGLRQQRRDLDRHLQDIPAGDRALLRQLRDRHDFRALMPPNVRSHEQALFTSDLALLLESAPLV